MWHVRWLLDPKLRQPSTESSAAAAAGGGVAAATGATAAGAAAAETVPNCRSSTSSAARRTEGEGGGGSLLAGSAVSAPPVAAPAACTLTDTHGHNEWSHWHCLCCKLEGLLQQLGPFIDSRCAQWPLPRTKWISVATRQWKVASALLRAPVRSTVVFCHLWCCHVPLCAVAVSLSLCW